MEDSLSISILKVLRDGGRTLKQIGDLLGLSESFVSRVARGERNLTVAHIDRLQQVLEEPVLLRVIESRQPPAEPYLRKIHDGAVELLRASAQLDVDLKKAITDDVMDTSQRDLNDELVTQSLGS